MITESNPILFVLSGPTASGKTVTGIELAKHFSTEIISADSRQFYREMKIGTSQPSRKELETVKHHFIGHLSVADPYNVWLYESDAIRLIDDLLQRKRIALLVGGSGLYIRAVCEGIDDLPDPDPALRGMLNKEFETEGIPVLQERLRELDPVFFDEVDRSNPKRLIRAIEVCLTTGKPYSSLRQNRPKNRFFRILKAGIFPGMEELEKRISDRVDRMITDGLPGEVKSLLQYRKLNSLNTVGYKEIFEYFDGKCSLPQAIERIKTNTRKFAKRQLTWFRKDKEIKWFGTGEEQKIIDWVNEVLEDH